MASEDRHTFILRQIEDRGSVSVVDLASQLGVSEMTIRRDLTDLEKEGGIRRVHGGAVGARGRSYEPPLILREAENQDAKVRIGKMAASLVAEGDSIALDIGSTTLEIARHLVGRRNLTVVTSSLHIATLIYTEPEIRLILTGGIVRHGESSMIGDLARHAYQALHVDRLFLAVAAVDAEAGLTEYNWDDALVKQAMIESAKEVILVADSSKFDRVAFARVAPLGAVHQIVTDRAPSGALSAALQRSGTRIRLAVPGQATDASDEE
jgi:DeoR/GlpR family transcriptional regulator of sugar metabolism